MTVATCPTCANVGGHYPGCPEEPGHVDRSRPPIDYAHNPHAEAARRLKAAYLMDALKAAGHTPATARALDQDARRALEKAGGVRRGSDETWELAATLLEEDLAYHAGREGTALDRVRAYVEGRAKMPNLDPDEINSVWPSGEPCARPLTMTDLRELIRLADREEHR